MATLQTLTLLPTSDISVQHTISSGNNGFACINSQDIATTFVHYQFNGNQGANNDNNRTTDYNNTSTSTFGLDGDIPAKFYVTNVNVTIAAFLTLTNIQTDNTRCTCNITPLFTANGVSGTGNQYTLANAASANVANTSRNYSITGSVLNKIYYNTNSFTSGFTTVNNGTLAASGKNATPSLSQGESFLSVSIQYYSVFDCVALNGEGIETSSVSSAEVVDGNNCTFTCTVNEDYKFTGWYDVDDNLVSTDITYTTQITSNITLIAKSKLMYKLQMVYVNSSLNGDSTVKIARGLDGDTVTLPEFTSNPGYRAIGWYDNENGNGTPYSNYTFSNDSGNFTLYAVSKILYTVKIFGDNITLNTQSFSGFPGESITFVIENIDPGYSLNGWYTDDDVKLSDTMELTYTLTERDMSIYVRLIKVNSITIKNTDGCVCTASSYGVLTGDYVTVTADIDPEYIFMGWYVDEEHTNMLYDQPEYTFQVNGDVTVYAYAKMKPALFVKTPKGWVKTKSVYKKINGSWVEQTDKTIVVDNNKKYIRK